MGKNRPNAAQSNGACLGIWHFRLVDPSARAAEASLTRALAIREKKLPADSPWVAISLENLASLYIAKGDQAKAAPLVERLRSIRSGDSS